MAFHEVRFPTAIAFGATGGPERRTDVVTIASGAEERNGRWAHSRRRYNAGYGVRSLDELHEVLAFFEARAGRLYGFRFRDHVDFKSCPPSNTISPSDQLIGTGDGFAVIFPLVKVYRSGAESYQRPITKPVEGSVRVAVAGTELAEGNDFTVEHTSGEVHFATAPAAGTPITAGFMFDVPVRFDADVMEVNLTAFQAGEIPNIPLVEVRV